MPGWSIVYGKYFSCGRPVKTSLLGFYWLLQSFSFNHMLKILMCFTATFLFGKKALFCKTPINLYSYMFQKSRWNGMSFSLSLPYKILYNFYNNIDPLKDSSSKSENSKTHPPLQRCMTYFLLLKMKDGQW